MRKQKSIKYMNMLMNRATEEDYLYVSGWMFSLRCNRPTGLRKQKPLKMTFPAPRSIRSLKDLLHTFYRVLSRFRE